METTQELTWARGLLGRQPAGHNDIWWCEAKDGPTIPISKGKEVFCHLCGQHLVDDKNRHDFAVHIEFKRA